MAFNYPSYGYGAYPYMPQSAMPQFAQQNAVQGVSPSASISNQPMQNGFICRPVTSRIEAEAVQVDFMGPGTVMPDLAHGTIYLKRFNPQSGSAEFLTFTAQQEQAPVQYATAQEVQAIRAELEALKHGRMEAGGHDE